MVAQNFIPSKAVQSEQTPPACIGRYLPSRGHYKKDVPGASIHVHVGDGHRDLTVSMMHLVLSRLMQLQRLSSNVESYNGPWNFGFLCVFTQHGYSFFAVALLHVFVDIEEHCLQLQ